MDISQTIFDLADVSNDDVANLNLHDLSTTNRCKLVFMFNLALKTSELSFLLPVIERCDEDDDDNGGQNSGALDPTVLFFLLVIVF